MPAARKNKTPEASESRRKPARVPIYRKIFLELRRRIQDGEFKLGQYLPGERELCDAFDISRITAVRVLNDLANTGLVVREQGRGTRVVYVARGLLVQGPTGFPDSVGLPTGDSVSVQNFLSTLRRAEPEEGAVSVLDFSDEDASDLVAQALQLPVGSPVRRLTRVWRFGGRPYNHLESRVPADIADLFTRDDLMRRPLSMLIDEAGFRIEHIEETVSATLADELLAERLEVTVGSPLLRVARVQHDRNGRAIQFVVGHYPSDRYHYRVSLSKQGVRRGSRLSASRTGL